MDRLEPPGACHFISTPPAKINNGAHTLKTCTPLFPTQNQSRTTRTSFLLSASLMAETQQEEDDDELFGGFKFVSAPTITNKQNDNDDDWGDFMDNYSQTPPPQSNGFYNTHQNPSNTTTHVFFDPLGAISNHSPQHNVTKSTPPSPPPSRWEKPRGALPLSFFGGEEEEEQVAEPVSDPVNSAKPVSDTRDVFTPKPVSPVANGFNDLFESFYGQIEVENRSNLNSSVQNGSDLNLNLLVGEDNGDFDEDDWEFKVADGDARAKEDEKVLNLRDIDIQEEPTTSITTPSTAITEVTKREIKADEIMWGSSRGSQVASGFSNNAGFGGDWFLPSDGFFKTTNIMENGFSNNTGFDGDWFLASNGFSKNTNIMENGFHFKSSVSVGNNSNLNLVGEPNQIVTENGKDSDLVDDKYDSDETFGDFKESSPEPGAVYGLSTQKEELKISDHSGCGTNELLFDDKVQENEKGSENNQIANNGGALPLSMFSDENLDSNDSLFTEDASSYKPTTSLRNGITNQVFSPNVSLNDLIYNLYSLAEHIPAVGSTPEHTENGFHSSAQTRLSSGLADGEDDFDNDSWEFKDASPGSRAEDPSSVDLGYAHQNFSSDSHVKSFVEFYCTLKERSGFIALYHLDGMKNAQNVATVSGEHARAAALHEEIQAAYMILQQENVVPEEEYVEECPTGNISMDELLKIINEPKFHVLASEYQLSRRISLAEKELSSAIALFRHAISVLKILTLGSMEGQFKYTAMWSRMISACSQELNHGTIIWKQSLQKNVQKQILCRSEGKRYIIALGEIYRVVGILRASATIYKPWILSTLADPMDIFASLEECGAAWSASGLEEALQSIVDPVDVGYYGTIEALLESTKSVDDVNMLSLQNHNSLQEPVCRLSLLSLGMLSDMKTVNWNGEHYFLAVANFWANRVSYDPPELPHIHFGS